MNEKNIVQSFPQAVYAAYSMDIEERLKSSSGGIFRLLAEYVISIDGLVYGVAMSEDCCKAKFLRVSEIQDIDKLQGSKYLQASVNDTYRNVKMDLDTGKYVLFTGTGCQVNGLKSFLRKEYPRLFAVDILCHGTPSPTLWGKYLSYIENEHYSKVMNINFRCKDKSWSDYEMKVIDEEKKQVFISKNVDPYMQMFLRNYSLRPSCYECVAKRSKWSDLTIADFWGINDVALEMNDGKGISLIMIRTDVGLMLFEKIKDYICCKSVTYEDGVKCNSAEYSSANRPLERDHFFIDMNEMDFDQLKAKYAAPIPISLKMQIKRHIKRILKIFKIGKSTSHKNSDYSKYGLLFELKMINKEGE